MEIKKTPAQRMRGSHPEDLFQQMRIRTQEQAAGSLGCDVRTLQRYESGKKSPERMCLAKMMELYDCTADELLVGKGRCIGKVMG